MGALRRRAAWPAGGRCRRPTWSSASGPRCRGRGVRTASDAELSDSCRRKSAARAREVEPSHRSRALGAFGGPTPARALGRSRGLFGPRRMGAQSRFRVPRLGVPAPCIGAARLARSPAKCGGPLGSECWPGSCAVRSCGERRERRARSGASPVRDAPGGAGLRREVRWPPHAAVRPASDALRADTSRRPQPSGRGHGRGEGAQGGVPAACGARCPQPRRVRWDLLNRFGGPAPGLLRCGSVGAPRGLSPSAPARPLALARGPRGLLGEGRCPLLSCALSSE